MFLRNDEDHTFRLLLMADLGIFHLYSLKNQIDYLNGTETSNWLVNQMRNVQTNFREDPGHDDSLACATLKCLNYKVACIIRDLMFNSLT